MENWESTYDLLVSPPGTVMNKDKLMELNFSLGFSGGISYNQYEGIKSIIGIETASQNQLISYTMEKTSKHENEEYR